MMPKELFKEIIEDPLLKEKISLSDDHIKEITISSKTEDDYLSILKIILFSIDGNTPQQTVYKKIRNYYGIN